MRKNILISTTRQWNPGDEFIMHGALNALQHTFGDVFNPIIYNRNPDIRGGSKWRNSTRQREWTFLWDKKDFRGKGILSEIFRLGHYENSYKDDMGTGNIDLAIFAGSPEWFSNRLLSMYRMIERENIPAIFLGLGAGDRSSFADSDPIVKRVLSKARLITTRDTQTEELLSEYHAKYVPCPAFLAAKENREIDKVERIGLIYATNHTVCGNNVSEEMHAYIVGLYKVLASMYDVALVCHYIDEVEQARKEFPDLEIFYSYDSKDYAYIYGNFDLVLGGRVHGIGISASLGIPGIMIKHDSRSNTTDGFLANSVKVGTEVDKVCQLIEKIKIDSVNLYSIRLREHKKAVMGQYADMLRKALPDF